MQPIEIKDSQISYHRTEKLLMISIPSYPHFKQLWKIANRNLRDRALEEGLFGEAFVSVILTVTSTYLMPFTAIQQVILNPILRETWYTFPLCLYFIYYLTSFAYFTNGSTRLELTPETLRLFRKAHLLGYWVKVKTVDISQVQLQSWKKLRHSEKEPRVLCSLVTKQRSYQLGRAISRAEAEWVTAEVANFLRIGREINR
jgi:hypothetical protein